MDSRDRLPRMAVTVARAPVDLRGSSADFDLLFDHVVKHVEKFVVLARGGIEIKRRSQELDRMVNGFESGIATGSGLLSNAPGGGFLCRKTNARQISEVDASPNSFAGRIPSAIDHKNQNLFVGWKQRASLVVFDVADVE